jgi:hypothetical protein
VPGGVTGEAGTGKTLEIVGRRLHEMIVRTWPEPAKSALVWSMYIAPRDEEGNEWTELKMAMLQDLIDQGRQMNQDQFREWTRGVANQWRRKLQSMGTDYLQLIPLVNWLRPGENESYFWKWQPAMYVRDLSVEGRKAITAGLVGSGKTNWSIWCAEQLARLKDGLRDEGPASVFAQIRRSTVREGYRRDPEEVEEAQLGPGEPIKSLGLYNATDVGFVSNFSIRDRANGTPSPIKSRWKVAATFSGILRLIGENLRAGKFTHTIIDEAGTSIDRNLSTSYQMKTWRDFFRLGRKLNGSANLLTQHEKTDFPDDVLDDATCFTRLIPRDDAKGPKGGYFNVPGFLNDEYLTDIPRSVTDFATDKTPGTIIDVRMGDIVNYMARREVEYESTTQKEWGVAERVDALFDGIGKLALSEGEMDEISRKRMGRMVA